MSETTNSINTKVNQSCWNCGHFQRWAVDPVTEANNAGECRKDPMAGYRYDSDWFDEYWPFMEFGDRFWCAKWKKSNLPIPTKSPNPTPVVWPDDWFAWFPWNVREPLNQSCWNCNHFQRYDEEPTDTYGSCRKNPDLPVLKSAIGTSTDTIRGEKVFYFGDVAWCSCWEKTENPNPDPEPRT